MNDLYCPDCFKEQRSLKDIYQKIKIDAQKFANKENTKVAIIQEGAGFSYTAFKGSIPGGTCEIIIPMS